MVLVIEQIKNGWLLAVNNVTVYCKDNATLHKELEFVIGKAEPLPEPPLPPTTAEPKVEGVRQFDDED